MRLTIDGSELSWQNAGVHKLTAQFAERHTIIYDYSSYGAAESFIPGLSYEATKGDV